jgi:NitT/TauT family transport system substrate-binding protein
MNRVLVALLTVLLVLLPASAQEQELQPETLLMTFVPNVQFSNVYVSIDNGYFADAGYDVALEYLNEPDVIDLVAADQNRFGLVSGEQVILAAARGRPITFVYEWFQQYPVGVVVSADADIESPEDLAGLQVGVPGRFGASYSGLTTLLQSVGLEESDIDLQAIGFAAPDVFCVGGVQASTVYVNNEPLQIQNRADQGDCGDVESVQVLRVSDYVDLVSNGLITNQRMIAEQPEQVAAMVEAFDAGLRDTINNPAQAYLISANYVENLPLPDEMQMILTAYASQFDAAETRAERDDLLGDLQAELNGAVVANDLLQFEVLLATLELLDAEQLGFSDAASWDNTQETLLTLGILEAPIELDDIFTNRFVPAVQE